MATALDLLSWAPEPLELHTGDHMDQREFHRIYRRMPEDFKAELIGGIVYVASPLKLRHGTNHLPLGTLFYIYEAYTPGVESADNTTVLLGADSEPQPDLFLRILPEYGGRSRTRKGYVVGAPEVLGEISHSSRSIDLHAKRDDYARYGVLEYLVVCLREKLLRWFDLRGGQELAPDDDGIYRIRSFPGLWIHGKALLARDHRRLLTVLQHGLASPEHDAFVQHLQRARSRKVPRRDRNA